MTRIPRRPRLWKAERELVEREVDRAFAEAAPAIQVVRRAAIDRLLPRLPPALRPSGAQEFLNRLGNELWMDLELAALVAESLG